MSLFYLIGFGMGISISASNVALNTYFKQKRRKAAGFSWAITGLGPIIFPYVVTTIVPIYGVQSTVFVFAALSLNTVVSAMIYQPVKYHAIVKYTTEQPEAENVTQEQEKCCEYCELHKKSVKDDDQNLDEEYNMTSPGTPMLARANDGWYGSKLSLSSNKVNFRTVASYKDVREITNKTNSKGAINSCTCHEINLLQDNTKKMTIIQKIVVFFDLDLLKDFTYVNLVIGLTIINFGEMNFSILTPFILHDFGLQNNQITVAMSLLASLDISMRFLIPCFTHKIKLDNRIFFMIGVLGIAFGRTVLTFTRSYPLILGCFAWIGVSKGVRTAFWPLIIPSFVPLKRLPAATGLQLVITGLFGLAGGPIVGVVRDKFDYSICLHFFNMMSFTAAVLWSLEAIVRHCQKKRIAEENEVDEKLNQPS